jgi:glutaminyl-tRNA synthetase
LFTLSTKAPTSSFADANLPLVVSLITEGKIASNNQVDAAVKYLTTKKTFSRDEFDVFCGIGVTVTKEDMDATIDRIIEENKERLSNERWSSAGRILGQVTGELKWGDGKYINTSFNAKLLALLGPKDDRDTQKVVKKAEPVVEKKTEEKSENGEDVDDFRKSGRDIVWAENTEEELKSHLDNRPAKIVTRFPPEPNGFLHLGHAKAMAFNFGIAKKHNGWCYMRFDDTNPTAEKKVYIDSILENISAMGHVPSKVTYTSSYFPELHALAVKMIKSGYAYVCHQTKAEIEESRNHHPCIPSPYRNRSVEENLKLFEDMRKGKFAEGAAVLRMKGDLASANPQMWDLVAYRIMFHAHPMTGDAWCIYPSYDYSHCIIDSLENITHSLCTLEFEMRRESYFWLLWVLKIYKPKVWEYSRLSMEYNVLSKRKLITLVDEKIVRGWDDPRLLTINGLRRRGFSATAINNFCAGVGVTRNQNSIPWHVIEHHVRADLEPRVPRAYCVVDPLKVTITNYPSGSFDSKRSIPNHPFDEKYGSRIIDFTRTIYIERSDFRLLDDKSYFGLAPHKTVHLKYGFNITCTGFTSDSLGNVSEIQCTFDIENKENVKGKIHWVSAELNCPIEVRLYDYLFTVPV